MDTIKDFFKNDKFAEFCGIELLEVSPGQAKARMQIQPHHLNGMGTAHGGVIFTLADFAFAVAANSHGIVAVAINTSITFTKAVSQGILYAEASENSVNPKLGAYTVRVTDENNDVIAIFQGLAYRKKEKITASS
jgi:acyl-CoA thioesterase